MAKRAAEQTRLTAELWQALVPGFLEVWYPRALDTQFGGFYGDLSMDFEPRPEEWKDIVVQSRHTWTASKAAAFLPDDRRYPDAASHGFRFLRDVMWDRRDGGFLPLVYGRASDGIWPNAAGRRPPGLVASLKQRVPRNRITRAAAALLRRRRAPARPMVKTTYGQAFAIFALAAYYAHSTHEGALALARAAFAWIDEHAHDDAHHGYASFLARDGTPLGEGPRGEPPRDFDTILHLIEAFTELLAVWPDPLLERRLAELVDLICHQLVEERGTGWTTFQEDWTPIRLTDEERRARDFTNEHISFGHDIETAALLIEAAEVLHLDEDAEALRLARRMVDHSLDHGWDPEHGGLFGAGYYFDEQGPCEVVDADKLYWVQAETLNTLSLMVERFPGDARDDNARKYMERLVAHWEYCRRYLIDHARGGWYFQGLDVLAEEDQPGKGRPIHGTYHVGRALMNACTRLTSPPPIEPA